MGRHARVVGWGSLVAAHLLTSAANGADQPAFWRSARDRRRRADRAGRGARSGRRAGAARGASVWRALIDRSSRGDSHGKLLTATLPMHPELADMRRSLASSPV